MQQQRQQQNQKRPDTGKVYIRDDDYEWLPARIISINSKDGEANVLVELPQDWDATTSLEHSCLNDDGGQYGECFERNVNQEDYREKYWIKRTVQLKDYEMHRLPIQNPCEPKNDMSDLPFLHEASILYNIKECFSHQKPFIRVRDIIVAMNPFEMTPGLYSTQTKEMYAMKLIWHSGPLIREENRRNVGDRLRSFGGYYNRLRMEPHIYEHSSIAYRRLAVNRIDQTILVSGETGAGKTETVKNILTHLASIEHTRPCPGPRPEPEIFQRVAKRVNGSSPVFESFGNAQTKWNVNSSRFGKLIQLQFDTESTQAARNGKRFIPSCRLVGCNYKTGLLEKSRIVSFIPGERSFHIFYQLLASPEAYKQHLFPHLQHLTPNDFKYATHSENCHVHNKADAAMWQQTIEALRGFQLPRGHIDNLMRAVAIVLQLGNLVFQTNQNGTMIASRAELENLSTMMGIPAEDLEVAMTQQTIKANGEKIMVQTNPSAAKDACDIFAKELYARIFDYIVRTINGRTRAPSRKERFSLISLLDFSGSESFGVNRFQQLCVNYTNELIQQKYVSRVFKMYKDEYEAEGINLFDFRSVDNFGVVDLLDGKDGIVCTLNQECMLPMSNDLSFVFTVKDKHKDCGHLIDARAIGRTEFVINHFAGFGPIKYSAASFVKQNKEDFPIEIMDCATRSTNPLIKFECQTKLMLKRSEKKSSGIVLEKFRGELKDFMTIIDQTEIRFIRCIKPNDTITPRITNHKTTMRQLRSAGLVTAVRLSRQSFPRKMIYKEVVSRFGPMMRNVDVRLMNDLDLDKVKFMFSFMFPPNAKSHDLPFVYGRKKVFFRAGALEHLEAKRHRFFSAHASNIQKWTRKQLAMKHFSIALQSVRLIQAWFRGISDDCAWPSHFIRREHYAAAIIQNLYRKRKATKLENILGVEGKLDNHMSKITNNPILEGALLFDVQALIGHLHKQVDDLQLKNKKLIVERDQMREENKILAGDLEVARSHLERFTSGSSSQNGHSNFHAGNMLNNESNHFSYQASEHSNNSHEGSKGKKPARRLSFPASGFGKTSTHSDDEQRTKSRNRRPSLNLFLSSITSLTQEKKDPTIEDLGYGPENENDYMEQKQNKAWRKPSMNLSNPFAKKYRDPSVEALGYKQETQEEESNFFMLEAEAASFGKKQYMADDSEYGSITINSASEPQTKSRDRRPSLNMFLSSISNLTREKKDPTTEDLGYEPEVGEEKQHKAWKPSMKVSNPFTKKQRESSFQDFEYQQDVLSTSSDEFDLEADAATFGMKYSATDDYGYESTMNSVDEQQSDDQHQNKKRNRRPSINKLLSPITSLTRDKKDPSIEDLGYGATPVNDEGKHHKAGRRISFPSSGIRRTGNEDTSSSSAGGKKGVRRRLSLQLFGNKSNQSSNVTSSNALSEPVTTNSEFSEYRQQNLPLHLVESKSDQIIDHVPTFMSGENHSNSSSVKKPTMLRKMVRIASFSDAGSIATEESTKGKRKTKRRLSLPMFKGFPKAGGYGEEEATSSLDDVSFSNHSVDGDFRNNERTQDAQRHRPSLGESISSFGSESSYSVSKSVSSAATSTTDTPSKRKKKGKSKSRRRLSLIFGGPGTGTIKEGKQQNMPIMRFFK